ncbi:MAG: methionine synthase, partial [Pseudolabrys sp.]|nr:methionine synthase [Pseudolabrys sp.]
EVETPEQIAGVVGQVMKYVAKDKIVCCTNCGMAPMRRDIAVAKLAALGKGAALARQKYA